MADPGRPHRRIAAFGNELAFSEDDGVTWRALAEGRFESIRMMAVGPDRRLYVAADGGLHALPLPALDRD